MRRARAFRALRLEAHDFFIKRPVNVEIANQHAASPRLMRMQVNWTRASNAVLIMLLNTSNDGRPALLRPTLGRTTQAGRTSTSALPANRATPWRATLTVDIRIKRNARPATSHPESLAPHCQMPGASLPVWTQGVRRAINTALVPPKANELDMTIWIRELARAWFGT
jgi:hypothetical protein